MKSKIAEYEPGTILFPDTTGIEKCFDSFTTDSELVKMLQERLDKIPKPEVQTLDDHISSTPNSDVEISDLENMIQKLTTSRIDSNVYNKHNNDTKPYYPMPTPPDLQYKESVPYRAYTCNTCYQFNIDGLLEYQIMTIIRQMYTIGYIYIKKQSMTHSDAVNSLASGI